MKRLHIKWLSPVVLCALVLLGCLKDKDYEDGKRGINIDNDRQIIEIAGPSDGLINIDLLSSNNDTTVNIVLVRLASAKPAESDIQVTLALDPAIVSEYNTLHGTQYQVPAASLFTMPSLTVTIPKGAREGRLQLRTRPANLIGTEYALGVRLVSVSGAPAILSGNYAKQVVSLTIRNQYDGSYRIKGAVQHPSLGGNFTDTGYPCGSFTLVTSGANSVELEPAQPFGSNGTIGGIFGVYPRFTIDPVTNAVTASDAAGSLSSVQNFSDYNSRYDPATKTFFIKWGWNGSRIAWDTLTYCGPR